MIRYPSHPDRAVWMRKMSRRCFLLMWIPFVGIFIGMWGMPEGSYDWHELPQLMRYSLVATGVLFFLTFALLLGSFGVGARARRIVLQNGRLAEAEILEMRDTGTTVNENPLVRFSLRVKPEHRAHFEAEVSTLVSRLDLPQMQPGETLFVKYLPNSRQVAIVDDPTGRSGENGDAG